MIRQLHEKTAGFKQVKAIISVCSSSFLESKELPALMPLNPDS